MASIKSNGTLSSTQRVEIEEKLDHWNVKIQQLLYQESGRRETITGSVFCIILGYKCIGKTTDDEVTSYATYHLEINQNKTLPRHAAEAWLSQIRKSECWDHQAWLDCNNADSSTLSEISKGVVQDCIEGDFKSSCVD